MCSLRLIECNSCAARVKVNDFGKHCFECHEDLIRNCFDKSKHDSLASAWESKTADQIGSIVNLNDSDATLGQTGKYYCGNTADACKTCCDGHCGPDSGCNCRACMLIDVA